MTDDASWCMGRLLTGRLHVITALDQQLAGKRNVATRLLAGDCSSSTSFPVSHCPLWLPEQGPFYLQPLERRVGLAHLHQPLGILQRQRVCPRKNLPAARWLDRCEAPLSFEIPFRQEFDSFLLVVNSGSVPSLLAHTHAGGRQLLPLR